MSDFRKSVAEELIKHIEAGTAPWQKPWEAGKAYIEPMNTATDKSYNGINTLILEMAATKNGYEDPRWMTFKQAKAQGASVNKGEKSTKIEYWQWSKEMPKLDEGGKPVIGKDGKPEKETVKLTRPEVFYANVFNAEQITGLEPYKAPEIGFDPIERAEKVLKDANVKIIHNQKDKAFYQPITDKISLPKKAAFKDSYSYYATALHETAHSTMHESRLDRVEARDSSKNEESYAREELRAEIASAMIARKLAIGNDIEDHASYVGSWIKALKKDPNEIFRAARDAEQISTWMLEPEKRLELQQQVAKKTAAENKTSKGDDAMKLENRHYINVSFSERNEAKAVGARWDGKQKSWYVAKDSDLEKVAKWDTPPPEAKNTISPVKEFGDFIRAQGVKLEGDPIMDGEWHRVKLEGQKGRGNEGGSYKGYLDGKPTGLVNNFRDGDGITKWVATGVTINANERAALQSKWEERKKERADDLNAAHAKASKTAYGLYANNTWAKPKNCPYLAQKGVGSYGVKQLDDGKMLIPARDIDGQIHSVQFVTPEGKSFLKGSRKEGCSHVIDPQKTLGKGPIIIAEGYATAASIHEATGRPVVVAFDSGNLTPVAAAYRGRYPKANIAIAADDDHKLVAEGKPNTGLDKAAKAAEQVGGHVIAVALSEDQKAKGLSDFDDLRKDAGAEVVKEQIESGLKAARSKSKGKGHEAEASLAVA